MQVVLSATLSRLLSLQLGFEHFQHISLNFFQQISLKVKFSLLRSK